MRNDEMSLTEDDLRMYLRENQYVDTDGIDQSTLLFSSGIIDSFALIELMTFIEDRTGVAFDAADVTLENLDSIELILAFVERSQAAGPEA